MSHSLVLVTASSTEEAEKIARSVLERRLAACVNLVPGVKSIFWWEGKLDQASETLMLIKTTEEAVPALTEAVKQLHSYSVCEVISLPVVQGNKPYLQWIEETVRP